MLRSGDLIHRVSIRRPGTPVRTPTGGSTPGAPVTVASDVPAQVRDLEGVELMRAMQTEARISVEVKIRYRSDVTSAMQIIDHRSRTLQIVAPPADPDGLQRELTLMCRVTS